MICNHLLRMSLKLTPFNLTGTLSVATKITMATALSAEIAYTKQSGTSLTIITQRYVILAD